MTLSAEVTRTAATAPQPQLGEFRTLLQNASGHDLGSSAALHRFSIEQAELFWRELLRWSGLPWSGSDDVVLTGGDVETARFFPDVRLNYAEALLLPLPDAGDDAPALTAVHADRPAEHLTRGALRGEVASVGGVLRELGVAAGDRVVLIAPNTAGTVVAALAVAALGAAVSTATPDMGAAALLGRFQQVEPALLVLDRAGMAEETVTALVEGLPSLQRVLLLDDLPLPEIAVTVHHLQGLRDDVVSVTEWERHPFDTPLFVMFSSGTTGPPKAMVHGIGGTLLEHVKEHRLHGDLRPADTLYFHTTTAWMMWNWQLSALAVGAHVVLYDGPVRGPETLWELVAEHDVTVFGTSPAYLQLCQDSDYRPSTAVDLSRLRSVMSTGAVLHDWQFDWVADAVGPVPLQSISGGTDIIGCFVLGSPELPVRRGRAQARSLGLDVAAVDEDGNELVSAVGELVCRRPFPSRPVGFLRDPDGARFHASYFADHPGMWTHGDLIDIYEDGSARLHGRSDGVLNIDGVRIGPSEIYAVLRGMAEIADSMAVEQRDPQRPGATRMVLLVVLQPGAELDDGLARRIRRTLRQQASAAHVPSVIAAVAELPVTHNGKKSERAARDAVNGDPVANVAALRNPDCLAAIEAAVEGTKRSAGPASRPPVHLDAEASNAVLRDVTRVWCHVLGVDAANPDDDFSDVGGTSREAMSLMRRVALELGVDVPLQEFLEARTPRGLADAVARRASTGTDAVPLLRPGHGRPLFFLGDAWGQVNPYAAIVERLRTERPVHGVMAPMSGEDGRRHTIPELAQHTAELIREVQPRGPYSLAGYSFGGLVAYETATVLAAAGEQISYLGLIDTLPPAATMTPSEIRAARWAHRLDLALNGTLQRALMRRLRAHRTTDEASSEDRFFEQSAQISGSYRPGPFDGAVTYYLAEDRLPVVGNTLAAWLRVAPNLMTTEIPGHHWDIEGVRPSVLAEHLADVLAARISATLR